MKHFSAGIIIMLGLLCSPFIVKAQNVTGTWEGYMTGEFIQINIEQKGNELCGYTYDYELDNKASHCIATFEGSYIPDRKVWVISGKVFIENSGSHVRMRIILWRDARDAKSVLKGQVYIQSFGGFIGQGDDLIIKRVAAVPQQLGAVMPPCFPKAIKPAIKKPVPATPTTPAKPTAPDSTFLKKATPKPITTTPIKRILPKPPKPIAKQPTQIKKDSVKKIPSPAKLIAVAQPDKDIVLKMIARKKTEQNRLEINVKKINLKVYDNGTIDNDTVSIFYNGKLLLSHQRLSDTAIELNITLEENISVHEIIMYAENLGGIPPNTALIVITAGGKRYELRSKANLQENAVLVIEYKPDRSF